MFGNKKILILIAVAVIIVVGGGAGYVAYSQKTKPTPTPIQQQEQQTSFPTLMPEDIGLTLSAITSGKFAGHGIDMKITNLADLASIDYELAYVSAGDIPRGAVGHVDIKPTDKVFDQQLPYGTCSDKCHFDDGISQVKITLKITKTDGNSYQLEEPFNQ